MVVVAVAAVVVVVVVVVAGGVAVVVVAVAAVVVVVLVVVILLLGHLSAICIMCGRDHIEFRQEKEGLSLVILPYSYSLEQFFFLFLSMSKPLDLLHE